MFVEEFWFSGLLNIEETGSICACGVGGCGNLSPAGLPRRPLIEFHNKPAKTNAETLKIQPTRYRKRQKFKQYVIKTKSKKNEK